MRSLLSLLRPLLLPLGLAALLIAVGCSKDKDVEPPATLVDFPQTLQVKKLWGEGVGGGKKQLVLRLGLGPALDNGVVFAASYKGEVLASELDTGRHVWLKNLKIPLSAGPAAGAGRCLVRNGAAQSGPDAGPARHLQGLHRAAAGYRSDGLRCGVPDPDPPYRPHQPQGPQQRGDGG